MKSGLFCHIHALQYCGNRLLLGQSLPGIVLRSKAQLGVEQALFFELPNNIKGAERQSFFCLQQLCEQLKTPQIFRQALTGITYRDGFSDFRIRHRMAAFLRQRFEKRNGECTI